MGGQTKTPPGSWPQALQLSTASSPCAAPSPCPAPQGPLKTRLVPSDALGSRSHQEDQARCLAWSGVTPPAAPAQGKPLHSPVPAQSAPRARGTAWPSTARGLRASSTSTGTPHKASPQVQAPNPHLGRCRVLSAGGCSPGWGNQRQNRSAEPAQLYNRKTGPHLASEP